MKLTQNKYLTNSEQDQLRLHLSWESNQLHVLLIEFAMFTGARQAEILEVTPKDIHKNQCITIFGKKNSDDRLVYIQDKEFFQRLQDHANSFGHNDKIFQIKTRMFRKLWAKLTPNKDKPLHCLRHTYVMMLSANGGVLEEVQDEMGHKNIKSTQVYFKTVNNLKKKKTLVKGMWKNKLDCMA